MSSKSKSWDDRSRASKLAFFNSSFSASEKETSKLAVRAYGTNWTLGEGPEETGEMECVDVEDDFLSTDRPESESIDRGLCGGELTGLSNEVMGGEAA